MRYDLKDVLVVGIDKTGKARLEFQNEAGKFVRDNGLNEIEARVENIGDSVLARAYIRR